MAKRAQLPKADAFFGAAPPELPTNDVTTSHVPTEENTAKPTGGGEGPPNREEGLVSSQDVSPATVGPVYEEEPTADAAKGANEDVEKVTLYLPPDIVKQLEVARVDLLLRYGAKVNRSRIAAAILRQHLSDISQSTPTGDRLVESLTQA